MFPSNPIIDVIIPAYNEQHAIGLVVGEVPDYIRHIVVVNNNSNDHTKTKAIEAGAIVVDEPQPGYGKACLSGMTYIKGLEIQPEIVVFMDADYSDFPEEMSDLIFPILEQNVDFVIGSRVKGKREKGSMTFPQIFGNWLATSLMRHVYGAEFSDLGPYRAIKWEKLLSLGMNDQNYGWTIEMQIKAHQHQLLIAEVPVNYKRRIGTSKVSGTIKGTFLAGYKILWTIAKYRILKHK
jgi:glycosyltransferase involved in cell wall biosynthesis